MIYFSALLIMAVLFLFAIGAFLIADSKHDEYRKDNHEKKDND